MIKIIFLILALLLFSACVNKHGISAKYYSDCKEYYDFQGYYHKECGDDDIVTYKAMGDGVTKSIKAVGEIFTGKEKQANVW